MLFLSGFPFGKISGLEYSRELVSDCLDNMSKWGIEADIICDDARRYTDYDIYNYFYLFNPFDENDMECFVKNLVESLKRTPRKAYVLYVNSMYKDMFTNMGFNEIRRFKKNVFHNKESVVLMWEEKGEKEQVAC